MTIFAVYRQTEHRGVQTLGHLSQSSLQQSYNERENLCPKDPKMNRKREQN